MRQIVLDTETTGLEASQGHRVIEIGCVELVNRKLTGVHFHQYLNPEREIDAEAYEVHGISNQFLEDKPRFYQIAKDFLEFIDGAELIIRNAAFDVGFIDSELSIAGEKFGSVDDYCSVIDSLAVARARHPGQKNNLDALCKRYGVDNSQRELHGALLDAEILADVYLAMTGGQTDLALGGNSEGMSEGVQGNTQITRFNQERAALAVIQASPEELALHNSQLEDIDKASNGNCIWLK